ncbi:MAG: acyl carrier protein [Oscillospiraceae bacterium]|nr:acyl carrier protein [Oscillospiraceae bacterium]
MFKVLRDLVAEEFVTSPDSVTMETSFEDDLGANSVDLVELAMAMEERFEIEEVPEEDLAGLKTVGDAVRLLAKKLK